MEITDKVILVHKFFSLNRHYAYSFGDLQAHFEKNHPSINRFLLMDIVGNLAKEDYITYRTGYTTTPHYRFKNPLKKKTLKVKLNFNETTDNN